MAAELPDVAASIGASVTAEAVAAGSTRTVRELKRLGAALHPWEPRPTVNAFLRLVATL